MKFSGLIKEMRDFNTKHKIEYKEELVDEA